MDQSTFRDLVAKALDRLYDLPYLQANPLSRVLVSGSGGDGRGQMLQRVLLDAIQSLRPPVESTGRSHAWRTYRYLFLRYAQVLPPHEVAQQLGVSQRQARRTHQEALNGLASILWDRCNPSVPAGQSEDVSTEPSPPRLASSPHVFADESVARLGDLLPGLDSSLIDQEIQHLATRRTGEPADLSEAVEGIRPIVDELARKRGCVWTVGVRQVLLNLCIGALERGCERLHLGAERRGEDVRIGLVLSPKPLSEATPTVSADKVESWLMISRRLAETVGGRLDLIRTKEGSVEVVAHLPALRQPMVLVVDDNPDVAAVFRRYLETAGLEVMTAYSGTEGFRLAREAQPAVITLDVMMAAQDGWETLQLLKNHPETQAIPVIICSVLRQEETALLLGAAELLPKPVTRPMLLAALARCGLRLPAAMRRSSS